MANNHIKQKTKAHIFAKDDLKESPDSEFFSKMYDERLLYEKGLQAEIFLRQPIFHEAVQDLYLALVSYEDNLPVSASLEQVNEYRIQRRLLLQVIGNLDNRVAEIKNLDAEHKAKMAQQAIDNETLKAE